MRIAFFSAVVPAAAAVADLLAKHHELTLYHLEKTSFAFAYPDVRLTSVEELEHTGMETADLIIYYAASSTQEAWLNAILAHLDKPVLCVQERPVCAETAPRFTQAEASAAFARAELKRRVTYLSVPAVYGEDYLPEELMDSLCCRSVSNSVLLHGSPDLSCDLLRDVDLASLLLVLCREQKMPSCLTVNSGNGITMGALAAQLREELRMTQLAFDGKRSCRDVPEASAVQDWTPEHSFHEELPELLRQIEQIGKAEASVRRGVGFSMLGKLGAFIGLFVLVNLYTDLIRVSSELQFVDVRLLFVVGVSLFFGRRFGLAAGICVSIASIASTILNGTPWHVIFFHIDNWIPVAVYLASAVLFGMYHENHQNARTQEVER